VGLAENIWLECKVTPYVLDNPKKRLELAKDVAGLANRNGGMILLGPKTERSTTIPTDVIVEIRPFSQSIMNPEQYYEVLKQWVYPELRNIEILWFPSKEDVNKGITAIIVPDQPNVLRPFLMTKTFDENEKLTEMLFGFAERRRAAVDSMTVQRLHSIMKDGLHFGPLSQRIENIESILQQLLEDQRQKENRSNFNAETILTQRTDQALIDAGLRDLPAYTIGAAPVTPVDIPTLFEGRNSDIVKLLDSPPKLRHYGFDLNVGKMTNIVAGRLRRALAYGYKLLELWRDGVLIFAATGGSEFLSWGSYRNEQEPLRINDYALIESVYLFVRISEQVFARCVPQPKQIVFHLGLKNMSISGQPCRISSSLRIVGMSSRAPGSDTSFILTTDELYMDSSRVAFMIVSRIYEWFGVDHEKIPFKKVVNGRYVIDPDPIAKTRD
jgi:hypothetical protein